MGSIKKVNVATGAVTSLYFDAHNGCCGSEYGVQDISIANNGTALFTTRGAGSSGFSIRELDLTTGEINGLKGLGGRSASLHRGADRSTIFIENWTGSGEPIYSYDAETKTFPLSFSTYRHIGNKPAAVNRDGSQYALTNSLMDDDWDTLEIFPNVYAGYTFDPLRDILYYSDYSSDEIVVYDTTTLSELGRVAIGENIGASSRLEISDDTNRLFVRTPSGVRMIDNPLPAAPDSSNASFGTGADLNVLNLDFGTIALEEGITTIDFDVSNLVGAGLTANLNLQSITASGDIGPLTTDLLSFANLTSGDTRSFTSTLDMTAPGTHSASYDLNFMDILGTSQTLTLNLTGTVVAPDAANASFATGSDVDVLHLDFGTVGLDQVATPIDFDIVNLLGGDPTADLDLVSIVSSGDTSILETDLAMFNDLAAGAFSAFQATLDTSAAGNYGASYDLNFTDILGTNQTLTLTLTGEVVAPDPANASFATGSDVNVLDLDFGTVALDHVISPIDFDIANLLGAGPTVALDLVSVLSSGDVSALETDLATFSDLAAGDDLSFEASLVTSNPGAFDATYELNFTDFLGNDQTLTLNLSGEVILIDDPSIPNLIYNAATGEVILDPDGAAGIIGYTLKNATDAFLLGNHTPILGGLSTSLAKELGEATFAAITSAMSIGNVLPSGLDIVGLFTLLGTNQVSTALGAPLVPFDLIVAVGAAETNATVPEPSTYAMAALGLSALGLFGWRRKRSRNDGAATTKGTPSCWHSLGRPSRVAVIAVMVWMACSAPASAASILIPFNADDFVYDNTNDMLYMIRRDHGSIGRFDASAETLLPSFNVGANLRGIDIGLNDQFIYVGEGNAGVTQGFVRKVDLATGAKTNIAYPAGGRERGVVDLSIAANNKLLFMTTYAGSSSVTLREIDLATDTVTDRKRINQNSSIDRGPDRSLLFIQQGNSSRGPIFTYDANTDTFPASVDTWTYVGGLNSVASIPAAVAVGGHQYDPLRDIHYVTDYSTEEIIAYDTNSYTEIGRFNVGENIGSSSRLAISANTDRIFVRTGSGVRMIDNPFSANAVASNASFDSVVDQDVLNIDLGTTWLQNAATPVGFDISNLVGAGVTTNLQLQSITGSGDVGTISTDLATFANLTAGDLRSFSSSIDSSVDGTYNASYDLNFTDFLGTNQTLTLNVTGNVITPDAANASFATGSDLDVLNLDFGVAILGEAAAPLDFDLANLLGGDPTAHLDLASIAGSGDTSVLGHDLSAFADLFAGDFDSFQATFDTGVAGIYGASYDLSFTDYLGNDQTLTLNLSGEVIPPDAANASFATGSDVDVLNLDFGTVTLDSATAFEIANLLSTDPTADLDLLSIVGSGDTTTLLHDLTLFSDLAAGSDLPFQASLDTSMPGDFDATYELSFTDLLGNDQTITLNLSGEIVIIDDPAIPDLIYNATTGEVIIDPDGAAGIIGYTLKTATSEFLSGNFIQILGGVFTSSTGELSEASFATITTAMSIGNVLPTGLDIEGLFTLLGTNQVATGLGSPLVPFDLRVVLGAAPAVATVPEPSTYMMAAIGLLGLGLIIRRRKRA